MARRTRSSVALRRLAAISAPLIGAGLLVLCAADLPADEASQSRTGAPLLDLSKEPSLAQYVAHAVESNPEVRAAAARWAAAGEVVTMAGSLPDPTVSYGYFTDAERARPTKQTFGIMQMFPWFGKLTLAQGIAGDRADAAHERVRGARLAVARDVVEAYWEYAYVGRATEITRAQVELLEEFEAVVRTRYSGGGSTYGDLLMVQIELARMTNELETMVVMRPAASGRLAAAIGISTDMVLPWPSAAPKFGPIESFEGAWARTERDNPQLRALALERAAARKSVDLARKEYIPDVSLGAEYMAMRESEMAPRVSDESTLAFMASLSVPLWFGKHRAQVRAAADDGIESQSMFEARRNQLEAELRMVIFEIEDAARRVALYDERLIPMANQSLKAAEAAYRGGTIEFDALVAASETLLAFQMAHARAVADRAGKEAELSMLVGDDAFPASAQTEEHAAPPAENHQ